MTENGHEREVQAENINHIVVLGMTAFMGMVGQLPMAYCGGGNEGEEGYGQSNTKEVSR